MAQNDKLRRAIFWFPAVFFCLVAGSWLADFIFPQGMSFGTPLPVRIRLAFQPSAYPPELIVINAVIVSSLLLADVATPHKARGVLLCMGALIAGGLYYGLFLGNLIDELFLDWPSPIGEMAALSSLLWPHMALVGTKLALNGSRLTAPPPSRDW
ncbi:MAG: hypothetical protein ABL864_02205 [Terricaulis sp.]